MWIREITLIYINPIYEIDIGQRPNIKKYSQVCKAPLKFNTYSLKKLNNKLKFLWVFSKKKKLKV